MAAFFTELFRIDPDDVHSLLDPELERDDTTSLWLEHLGDLELVGLWESLPGAKPADTLMDELLSDPEAGVLIFTLPDDFLDSIESVRDADIGATAQQWGRMQELSHWKDSDLAQVIRDIRTLVREARASGQMVVQLGEV